MQSAFCKKTLILGAEEFDNIAMNYKNVVIKLINDYGLLKSVIIPPIPTSNLGLDNPKFPRNGLLHERILVTKMITDSLVNISSSQFVVFNHSHTLSNMNGSLDTKYTGDGVHLNFLGRKKLFGEVDFENI